MMVWGTYPEVAADGRLSFYEEVFAFVSPEAGMWHTTEALASGTIIFEAKDARYGEDGSEGW